MKQETARYSLWSPPTFAAATGALVAEATLAVGVFVLWTLVYPGAGTGTGPGAGDPSEDDSGALGFLALPFFLAAWTLVAAFLAAALVVPAAGLARWAGSRTGRVGARWWVPAAAASVTAPAVLAAALVSGHAGALAGQPVTCLWWWLGATAVVTPAGILTLVADHRAAAGRPPWRLPLWLLGGGCGGPLIAFVLVIVVAMVAHVVTG
ncbi:hypothetical protein FGW37_27410 [Streptomyces rectiverticillatus]|uniref:hypothetical protein n=1 Tax=Streptomyces rectiverticillatus TaxID=173860 RepID=UPI0015C3FCD9|nr:hypothetical protein [Streptomyces rectiverticillatus]QLE74821.1 hypothetical protein FGW37_27410 [Streptomyces rectiverticillatus]